MMPIVSIVMLTYNHGPYIRQAIEGVVKQQLSSPFELIIGEDCSSDNTREIVFQYGKAHPDKIRVIAGEKNVGALENLRRCESACRGEFVCYCDGDDYWIEPRKLERQVGFLQAHPEYAMVHSAFQMFYTDSRKVVRQPLRLPDDLNDDDAYNEILSGRRHVWPLTACVRRSVLEPILRECPECYDPKFLMADTQRWLEISRRGKVKYFPEPMATRQVLRESVTQSRSSERVLRFAVSNKAVFDHYIEKYGCSPEAKRAAKTRCAAYLLKCACDAGNSQMAQAALEEYRLAGAGVPLGSYLYFIGSKSAASAAMVRPLLGIINVWERACGRFKRVVKSACGSIG